MQDLRKGPPPDNGLEVMYHSATLGQRMLGHDEPIRVRQGERVLFRLLNASATMDVSLALPGHRFTVIALDGNPVPTPAAVDVLKLDVAERADVIVEMNNPGVWVFGSTDDDDREMGMGVVVEYENRRGEPQWISPAQIAWDYTVFARTTPAAIDARCSNTPRWLPLWVQYRTSHTLPAIWQQSGRTTRCDRACLARAGTGQNDKDHGLQR